MGKHALDRTQERYNMAVSFRDERNIINIIKNGRALHLDLPTKNEDTHFAYVLYKNIPLKVLYSEYENTGKVRGIVTVYPLDTDEYNELTGCDLKDKIELAKQFLQANKYVVYRKRG